MPTTTPPSWRDDAKMALALVLFAWLPALWQVAFVVENARVLRCISFEDESGLAIPFMIMFTLMPLAAWLALADQVLRVRRATLAREALLVGSMMLFPAALGGTLGWWLVARRLVDDPAIPGTLVGHPLAVTLAGALAGAVVVGRLALRDEPHPPPRAASPALLAPEPPGR